MPFGMALKSEGFATNLYDPDSRFTLKRFCAEREIAYADIGIPILLSTFTAYGLAFREEMVPNLEEKMVVALTRRAHGFALTFDDGEVITAQKVVLAVGITHFSYIPPSLTGLPNQFLTHSSQHNDLRRFKGKNVAVIGGGSSAAELATSLDDAGAIVQMIARRRALIFTDRPTVVKEFSDTMWQPISGIGSGWRMKILTNAPWLFHNLPRRLRHRAVRRWAPPAVGWFSKVKLESGPTLLLGYTLNHATIRNGRVQLELTTHENVKRELEVEHVVSATGYKVDIRRLAFLDTKIQSQLEVVEGTPVLSSYLQSSIPGLYFVGPSSANSFGPVMRFAFGADFTARRLAHVLAKGA